MTWDEYCNQKIDTQYDRWPWQKIDVECPKCGEKIYQNYGIVSASFPQKYDYKCAHCGWEDRV